MAGTGSDIEMEAEMEEADSTPKKQEEENRFVVQLVVT